MHAWHGPISHWHVSMVTHALSLEDSPGSGSEKSTWRSGTLLRNQAGHTKLLCAAGDQQAQLNFAQKSLPSTLKALGSQGGNKLCKMVRVAACVCLAVGYWLLSRSVSSTMASYPSLLASRPSAAASFCRNSAMIALFAGRASMLLYVSKGFGLAGPAGTAELGAVRGAALKLVERGLRAALMCTAACGMGPPQALA